MGIPCRVSFFVTIFVPACISELARPALLPVVANNSTPVWSGCCWCMRHNRPSCTPTSAATAARHYMTFLVQACIAKTARTVSFPVVAHHAAPRSTRHRRAETLNFNPAAAVAATWSACVAVLEVAAVAETTGPVLLPVLANRMRCSTPAPATSVATQLHKSLPASCSGT